MSTDLFTALEALQQRLPDMTMNTPELSSSGQNLKAIFSHGPESVNVTVIRDAPYSYFDIEKGIKWLYGGLDPDAAAEAVMRALKGES